MIFQKPLALYTRKGYNHIQVRYPMRVYFTDRSQLPLLSPSGWSGYRPGRTKDIHHSLSCCFPDSGNGYGYRLRKKDKIYGKGSKRKEVCSLPQMQRKA